MTGSLFLQTALGPELCKSQSSVIDQEKLQKGRGWAYLAGIVIFVAVVAGKFLVR